MLGGKIIGRPARLGQSGFKDCRTKQCGTALDFPTTRRGKVDLCSAEPPCEP